MQLKTVEERASHIPSYQCPNCQGSGSDVGMGWDGEPEQIQCHDCHAEGKYITLDCARTAITQDRADIRAVLVNALQKALIPKEAENCTLDEYQYNLGIKHALTLIDTLLPGDVSK